MKITHTIATQGNKITGSRTLVGGLSLVLAVTAMLAGEVHAQDVSVSSSVPTIFYDDLVYTNVAAEWMVYTPQFGGTSSPPTFSIYDNINNARVLRFNSSPNNGASLRVLDSGDMRFAGGAMYIQRNPGIVTIGGQENGARLNLQSVLPAIRFHDESDTSEANLVFNNGSFQLQLRQNEISLFRVPFRVYANSWTDMLKIGSSGRVDMQDDFVYNAPTGTLNIGPDVNGSVSGNTLQLTATTPEIFFLNPGSNGMELRLSGSNELGFNADIDGNGTIDTSGLASFSTNAPTDSLVVLNDGDVKLGDDFYFNSSGSLNLGDAVNAGNAGNNTLQLTSNSTPELYFLRPGDAGMELDLTGGRLRFNGDPDGNGLPNGANYSIFSINASAPANSLRIVASSAIGVGLSAPQARLHVRREDGSAALLVEENIAAPSSRDLLVLRNNGATGMRLSDSSTGTNWQLTNTSTGFSFSRVGSGVVEMRLANNGNLNIAGTLTVMSDRNAKTEPGSLEAQAILERVTALPLSRWEYKNAPGERHIGPMAQDFYASFQFGASETGIAVADMAGVALVAIQALTASDREIEKRNGQLGLACGRLEDAYQQRQERITRLQDILQQQQQLVARLQHLTKARSVYTSLK